MEQLIIAGVSLLAMFIKPLIFKGKDEGLKNLSGNVNNAVNLLEGHLRSKNSVERREASHKIRQLLHPRKGLRK